MNVIIARTRKIKPKKAIDPEPNRYGKITIIKSMALAKINHIISIIPEPNGFIKKLEKSLSSFLWNGKRPTVKHSTLTALILFLN